MLNFFCSLRNKPNLFLFIPVFFLLCGCSTLSTSQASPTPTLKAQFTSYVGKWTVHDALLTINANRTGLEQWNAGPCPTSATDVQLCGGNAQITFTENADGSIKGTIQSVNYLQSNGQAAPTGFQSSSDDPRAGDTFQLQHSGAHLLYTTWFEQRLSKLNTYNRYWCDSYALKSGYQQCGA